MYENQGKYELMSIAINVLGFVKWIFFGITIMIWVICFIESEQWIEKFEAIGIQNLSEFTMLIMSVFIGSLGCFFTVRAMQQDYIRARSSYQEVVEYELKLQKEFKEFKKQKEKNNDDDA